MAGPEDQAPQAGCWARKVAGWQGVGFWKGQVAVWQAVAGAVCWAWQVAGWQVMAGTRDGAGVFAGKWVTDVGGVAGTRDGAVCWAAGAQD